MPNDLISPLAHVSSNARLGKNVSIGDFTVVHDNVEIGDNCVINEHCSLGVKGPGTGEPLVIAANSTIRSHAVLYESSVFGPRLEVGHHVVIRERTFAGENLRVGNFSDVEGDCQIGDFCRFHGYTHVGKLSKIGHFVWLFSLVTSTNDPLPPSALDDPVEVGDGSVVCVGAILMPGAILGKGAFICAGAKAMGHIPAGAVVDGSDGRIINHVSRLMNIEGGLRHPWMRHYRSVYPDYAQPRIDQLLIDVMENRLTLKIGAQ